LTARGSLGAPPDRLIRSSRARWFINWTIVVDLERRTGRSWPRSGPRRSCGSVSEPRAAGTRKPGRAAV